MKATEYLRLTQAEMHARTIISHLSAALYSTELTERETDLLTEASHAAERLRHMLANALRRIIPTDDPQKTQITLPERFTRPLE